MVKFLLDKTIGRIFLLAVFMVAGGLFFSPVSGALTADFEIADTCGLPGFLFPVGDTLIFTDLSTGDESIVVYNWVIDNGWTSSEQDPIFGPWETPGVYSVTLTVVGSNATTSTVTKSLYIQDENPWIAANFSYTVDYEVIPAKITLFDQSETNGETIVAWYWNVDGNAIPDTQLPEFSLDEYDTGGDRILNINLTIVTALEQQMDFISKTIEINEPREIAGMNFAYVLEYGDAPFTIYFIPVGIGKDWTCVWNFGDGSAPVTEWDPRHTYTDEFLGSSSPYTVTLTATKGSDQEIITRSITVNPLVPPTPFYVWALPLTSAAPVVVAGQEIQFLDWSEGWADSWMWDFGDGQISSLRSPVHIYTTPGWYNVTLGASNIRGENQKYSSYILIGGSLTVEGDASPNPVNISESVFFTADAHVFVNQKEVDDSNSRIDTWYWDFGDGSYSTEKDPVHAYSWPSCMEGDYMATVTATMYDGTSATDSVGPIVVLPNPYAEFYWDSISTEDSSYHYGYKFMSRMCNAGSWKWDFNDGFGSEEVNPTHIFREPGIYNITLTVWTGTDMTGDTYSTVQRLIATPSGNPVTGSPNAGTLGELQKKIDGITQVPLISDFEASPLRINATETVQFSDLSTGWPTSWKWDFGDGTTSNLQSPNHTYGYPGTYSVSLETSNVLGQTDAFIRENYIVVQNEAPAITAAAYPVSGTAPLTVQFEASATVGSKSLEDSEKLIREWEWFIYDDYEKSLFYNWLYSSLEQNPEYTFERPGIYPVEVYCELYDGVWSMAEVGPIVVGPLPMADFYWEYLEEMDTCCYLVKFMDTSVGPTSWLWDFGDGADEVTDQNPTHRFKEAGSYNVTLTVWDDTGAYHSSTQAVQVSSGYVTPTPTPTPTPVPGQVDAEFDTELINTRTIQFTDTSSGIGIDSWRWVFGDGALSTEQNPLHIYPDDGEYTVSLFVSNGVFSDSVTKSVGVR